MRDLRYAFRRLAGDRSLVALAVSTLGLGIGLNVIAVCSLILSATLVACIAPAARVVRLDIGTVLRQ